MVDRCILIPLEGRIPVVVSIRIKEEILLVLVQAVVQRGILFDGTYRPIPTLQVRAIVVPNGVCVEHFPRVKGIVSGIL